AQHGELEPGMAERKSREFLADITARTEKRDARTPPLERRLGPVQSGALGFGDCRGGRRHLAVPFVSAARVSSSRLSRRAPAESSMMTSTVSSPATEPT